MAECGCLPPEQRDEVIEILDMFAYTLDDDERAKRIEKTRDDIRECKCPTSSSDDSKKKKKKREPSEYNIHTGTCMKTGKNMKECAVEWNKKKKEEKEAKEALDE